MMSLSQAGAEDLILSEGLVTHWYKDVTGTPTIGVGFTWASSAFRTWWAKMRPGKEFAAGATMTKPEAIDCLRFVVDAEYGAAVNKFLGRDVPQNVFDAMVSVTFNCGAGTLSDKWARAVKDGDLKTAASFLRSTRVTSKGKRLQGLVDRRAREADLLLNGKYATGRPTLLPTTTPADNIWQLGERGSQVAEIQRKLNAAGFPCGIPDGIFGQGTLAAVLAFQRAHGLTADGKVGPGTLSKLISATTQPDDPGTRPAAVPAPTRGIWEILTDIFIRLMGGK